MQGTIIQKNQVETTKQFLLDVPMGKSTRTWKPVSHGELINTTLESIDRCGFNLCNEVYRQSSEGLKANGIFHLNYGNDPDMSLMVGFQNSYDKTLSLKISVGGVIFICQNLVVRGDVGTFIGKHVGEIQTISPKLLSEYICAAGDTFEDMVKEKNRMKEIEITKRTTSELLGRMFVEESLITSTQLNIIKREIENPTFDYGCDDSVYQTYNFVTFSLKSCQPQDYFKSHINVHQFFKKEFAI